MLTKQFRELNRQAQVIENNKKIKVMSTRLIRKTPVQERVFTVGQSIKFPIWVPLQNIGTTIEWYDGIVVKVNRVTIDVQTANGNVYRVDKFDLK